MTSTPSPGGRPVARRLGVGAAAVLVGCLLLGGGTPSRRAAPLVDAALEVAAAGCSGLVPRLGSAVALGDDLVATMAHVVAGSNDITVEGGDGVVHPATIVAIDTHRDAAVLRVPSLDRPALAFGRLVSGEVARYYGFGNDRVDHDVTVTVDGAVSIVSEDIYIEGSYPRPGYQLTGDVAPGDSGAGVVSASGALAGLVWSVTRDGDGHGFAVSIDVVRELLPTIGSAPAAPVPCA